VELPYRVQAEHRTFTVFFTNIQSFVQFYCTKIIEKKFFTNGKFMVNLKSINEVKIVKWGKKLV
jgi:hypothetical protein